MAGLEEHRAVLCQFYFMLGLNYRDIPNCLAQIHGVCISLRTLKRVLSVQGLFRRKMKSDILAVAMFIEEQVSTTGNQQGYRWMHLRCIQEGLVVSRDIVAILMKILDPVGVELRLKKRLRRRKYFGRGPNYIWHIDSYDKLKQFGLAINGCIDGFSRQIIWVKVYITSSDPRVVAGYFIEAVSLRGGCPVMVRGDRGTENGHVAQMQVFLSGRDSFVYGKSTSNQRIEMFWSFLRRQCTQYWMDVLSAARNSGQFTGDFVDINLVQFCFLKLLQDDINDMVRVWNTHLIRPSKNQNCPSGRPMLLYQLPSVYGTRTYLNPVEEDYIQVCREECIFRSHYPCDKDIFNICLIYMSENNWNPPENAEAAFLLYRRLRRCLASDL